MAFRLDHAVVLVRDLNVASRDCADLGFTVVPGGIHKFGLTHNALMHFADGSFLELVAVRRRVVAVVLKLLRRIGLPRLLAGRRFALVRFVFALFGREGLSSFALFSEALAEDMAALRARGLDFGGPVPFSRERPDGVRLTWNVAVPLTGDLPFIRSAHTPRIPPDGAALRHANGAQGLASVTILVKDLERCRARYQALLDQDSHPASGPGAGDERLADFELGSSRIRLVAPVREDPLYAQIRRRGEGPYSVSLAGYQRAVPLIFKPSRAQGVVLEPLLTAGAGRADIASRAPRTSLGG